MLLKWWAYIRGRLVHLEFCGGQQVHETFKDRMYERWKYYYREIQSNNFFLQNNHQSRFIHRTYNTTCFLTQNKVGIIQPCLLLLFVRMAKDKNK